MSLDDGVPAINQSSKVPMFDINGPSIGLGNYWNVQLWWHSTTKTKINVCSNANGKIVTITSLLINHLCLPINSCLTFHAKFYRKCQCISRNAIWMFGIELNGFFLECFHWIQSFQWKIISCKSRSDIHDWQSCVNFVDLNWMRMFEWVIRWILS